MLDDFPENDPELIYAKLNLETAPIAWADLQKFFASGLVIKVDPSLDMIQIATHMSLDQAEAIKDAVSQGLVAPVKDQEALSWFEQQAILWSVVVRPWVLVQDKGERTSVATEHPIH